ncbi:hypothetical protein CTA1_5271 [Colletotrichum tanaceti]|uniref:Uncharacterized protein n=1 Tax=Colletotrichum tanaceti TaxID=1306861 RepID=A0A4U6XMY2_9PEZI|nr:hypothetical protein CTA1_5271 [Colletotrichum tanaceti]
MFSLFKSLRTPASSTITSSAVQPRPPQSSFMENPSRPSRTWTRLHMPTSFRSGSLAQGPRGILYGRWRMLTRPVLSRTRRSSFGPTRASRPNVLEASMKRSHQRPRLVPSSDPSSEFSWKLQSWNSAQPPGATFLCAQGDQLRSTVNRGGEQLK